MNNNVMGQEVEVCRKCKTRLNFSLKFHRNYKENKILAMFRHLLSIFI